MVESFDLRKQMLGGIGWISLAQFLRHLLQLIIIAVLARLLSVDDFGIMAIVMALMALSFSIGDLGLSAAIVQKKEVRSGALSCLFLVCVLAGLSFCIIMAALAPMISKFFDKAIISTVIKVISIKFIIDSFGIVHDTLLRKELSFKKVAFIDTVETLGFGITSVGLALAGLGVWSLVYGYIAGSLARVISLWAVHSWRPALNFNLNALNEFFGFAKNVLGFKVTSYLASNVDKFIIGRILGSVALGYYSMAYNISNFPREKLSGIIIRVGFPAFSRIQDDSDRLGRAYLKIITYASVIIFPLLFGLIALSPEFVRSIFTAKWSAMIIPLQYLAVAGMFSSITAFVGIIFLATGHAEIEFRFSLIYLLALVIALFAGVRFGVLGAALGICLQALTMNIVGFLLIRRLLKINLSAFLGAVFPALICSAIMLIVIKLFLSFIKTGNTLPDIFLLVSSTILGACAYYISLYVIKSSLIKEMLTVFLKKQ